MPIRFQGDRLDHVIDLVTTPVGATLPSGPVPPRQDGAGERLDFFPFTPFVEYGSDLAQQVLDRLRGWSCRSVDRGQQVTGKSGPRGPPVGRT
jgi:hypothetical protein